MKQPQDDLPPELQDIASRLRTERATLDPLTADQIKLRVLSRARTTRHGRFTMKSRLASILTLLTLVGGSGGAIAVANSGSGNGNGNSGSAAGAVYKPGKHCGDKNHIGEGSNGNNPQSCPPQSQH
jgi:hypothetical protein